MRLLPIDGDLIAIGRCHQAARAGVNGSYREGEYVKSKHDVGFWIGEGTLHKHELRPTHRPIRCTFLRWLKDELDRTR